jgi:hypothetical protein
MMSGDFGRLTIDGMMMGSKGVKWIRLTCEWLGVFDG